MTDVLDGYLARRNAARARAAKAGVGDGGAAEAAQMGADGDGGTGRVAGSDLRQAVRRVGAGRDHRAPPPAARLLVLIVSRELAQLPLSLVYRFLPVLSRWLRYDFRASTLGKAATVVQFLAITALILDHPSIAIFAVMAFVLGLAALVDYIRRAVVLGRSRWSRTRRRRTVTRRLGPRLIE